jgi:hypothetical protein
MPLADGTPLIASDGALMLDTDGSVRLADGVSDDCCCGGDDVCPDDVSVALQAKVYRIAGYTDGDIEACDDCILLDEDGEPWDGTFVWDDTELPIGQIWREPLTSAIPTIDGKSLSFAGISHKSWYETLPVAAPPDFCWLLHIVCADDSSMWMGAKIGGSTPVGVYTRFDGCDAVPATLTIEEVP